MKKNVAVLGSTGSIGRSTLNILRSMRDNFRVVGLTANQNLSLFKKQLEYWRPELAAVHDEATYKKLKTDSAAGIKLLAGLPGVSEVACFKKADIVICAISGSPALLPLYEAIQSKKLIGLASKEPVVMTGTLLLEEADKKGALIIPVDSEPNAIFQCLKADGCRRGIRNLLITASGGPFRETDEKDLRHVSVKDALSHPAWNMGEKISVDSATMINKGLEVIEASCFFGVPVENIKVLIHPEAKIHSMVEFIDGNVMAVISATDMRIPIQYALTYPERAPSPAGKMNFIETGRLTFLPPDTKKFPGLGYAYEAGRAGGTMPAVFNGANETAVDAFLRGKIRFTDIALLCREAMKQHKTGSVKDISHSMEADKWAKEKTGELIEKWD